MYRLNWETNVTILEHGNDPNDSVFADRGVTIVIIAIVENQHLLFVADAGPSLWVLNFNDPESRIENINVINPYTGLYDHYSFDEYLLAAMQDPAWRGNI